MLRSSMTVGKPTPNNLTINNLIENQTMGVSGEPHKPFGRYENVFLNEAEYKQIQPSDRANASWTLQQMHREEVYRLYDFVRSRVPGWKIGQWFDTSILEEYKQGTMDIKA